MCAPSSATPSGCRTPPIRGARSRLRRWAPRCASPPARRDSDCSRPRPKCSTPSPAHSRRGTASSAFGAQFVEVEVDVETGRVRVLRVVSVHDSGRIINPTLAESQLEGGILQGLGYALFEERVLDERLGLPLNPTMHDYKIPTIADLPAIDALFVAGADTVANHTGAKGLAEPPIIPVAPAIANAVADAIGVEVTEIPLTPWRLLAA